MSGPHKLPHNLTSYDLLKSAAVIIMVIDHIGWYFFPEDLWWRAVGRIGFPVWFFLVGYARGRGLGWKLWAGAAVLQLANLLAGMYIFPLNALATIIVIRLTIDKIMKVALHDGKALIAVSLVLFLLIPVTGQFAEYGTQALIMAMFGYMVRNRKAIEMPMDVLLVFAAFSGITFVMLQSYTFGLDQAQLFFVGAGTFAVMAVLVIFKSIEFPAMTAEMPRPLAAILRIGGRRTLEIYVIHLLLFKAAGAVWLPERYPFLDWTVFYVGNRPETVSVQPQETPLKSAS